MHRLRWKLVRSICRYTLMGPILQKHFFMTSEFKKYYRYKIIILYYTIYYTSILLYPRQSPGLRRPMVDQDIRGGVMTSQFSIFSELYTYLYYLPHIFLIVLGVNIVIVDVFFF